MFRRLLITTILFGSAVSAASAVPVTFLMRNGDRVVGDMTYKGGADYTLNGRDIPASDVAVIAFIPNDPTPREVSRVPSVDNNPSELERHVFVTRSGEMIFGKLYKFSPDGAIITFDRREGGRHDISANDIARIYINPAAARVVYGPILAALPSESGSGPVGTSGGTVTVVGNQQWTPTGFAVRRGETIRFNATGEVMWSPEAADRATPGGALSGRKAGNPPVGAALGGALVGRVGNGEPFIISNRTAVRMPASGMLFLGINDDVVADNTGDFMVTFSR
ncbi:MAG TPA: hypothetical protein VM818_07225 [Vicinamibacterales bacterium]|nr:hypothetical protein [Vicinamibacterales bacterium]